MCGIAGFLFSADEDPNTRMDRMLASMQARGPDGEGRFFEDGVALGMRRLAIRDIAHGQQPFKSADDRIVAFVNGEIYNYLALRRELEGLGVRFESNCDSEVLPHAFRIWGPDEFADRLDGMFGISILDRRERKLYLYRDRYGEKPIFYSQSGGSFRFASQLSTLAVEPEFDFGIDPIALRQYLALHYVPGPRTMVRGIRRLLPGHRLCLSLSDTSSIAITRCPQPAMQVQTPRNYEAATAETRRLLFDSVTSRLASDVPVGVFLSGGLDSSAIAAIAQQHSSGIETFSVGFQDAQLDESPYARSVAAALGTRHHHFGFDIKACLSVFDDVIDTLDEPVGDPACLPVFLLSREASQQVKVVLTGEGADEIFGGYAYYPEPEHRGSRFNSFLRALGLGSDSLKHPVERAFFQRTNATPSGFPMLSTHSERDEWVPGAPTDEDAWSTGVMDQLAGIQCPLQRAQTADLLSWLPDDLLTKLDRMTMASSIEGRAPYLEPKLAALARSLPAQWKGGGDRRKRILRDAVAPDLPQEIINRRKQGFVLPMQEWLLGPLRERLVDNLDSDASDGMDLAAVRRVVLADLERGAPRSRLLYGLLAYREWLRNIQGARIRAASRMRHEAASERSESA